MQVYPLFFKNFFELDRYGFASPLTTPQYTSSTSSRHTHTHTLIKLW